MAGSCGTRGRGSAMAVGALVTFLLLVNGAMAADYPVGGTGTWTFGAYQAWADGITFQAGDTISFTYDSTHDLIILNTKEDFDNCVVGSPKATYTTGNDKITLAEGTTYFTCGKPGHCGGMKFSAVVAQTAPPPTTPAVPPPTTPAAPPPTTLATPPPATPAGSPPSTPPTASTPTSPAPTATPPASGPSTKTPSPSPSTKTPSPHKAPAPAPSSAVSVKAAAAAATFVGAAALALAMI